MPLANLWGLLYTYIYIAYFDFWDLGRCQLYYVFLILFLSSIFTWLTRLKDQTYTMPLYLPLGSYRRLLRMKSCTTWHVQNPREKNRMIWILYLSQLARGFLPSPKHMGHMCFEAASQLETHCPWPHAAAGDCCLSKVARVPGWRLMVVLDPKHILKICEKIHRKNKYFQIYSQEINASLFFSIPTSFHRFFWDFRCVFGVSSDSVFVTCETPWAIWGVWDASTISPFIYLPPKTNMAFPCKKKTQCVDWKTFEPGPRYLFIPLLLMLFFGQNPSNSLECGDSTFRVMHRILRLPGKLWWWTNPTPSKRHPIGSYIGSMYGIFIYLN